MRDTNDLKQIFPLLSILTSYFEKYKDRDTNLMKIQIYISKICFYNLKLTSIVKNCVTELLT